MADLDDFFAKKDRKKSKSKKFATTEELARKSEDTSKKVETKPKKERPTPGADGEDANHAEQQPLEDEWKEFEEEERKDYSGLKIGQLQINEEESNTGTDGEGQDTGNDGDASQENSDRRKAGPWKQVAGESNAAEAAAQAATAAAAAKPTGSSVYISPGVRYGQKMLPARLRKGVLPDLNNEEYFPVLGSAKPEEVKKKKVEPGFEEVRHGGRMQRSSDLPTNAPVAVNNPYGSLSDS